jgi:hypothetical protein
MANSTKQVYFHLRNKSVNFNEKTPRKNNCIVIAIAEKIDGPFFLFENND